MSLIRFDLRGAAVVAALLASASAGTAATEGALLGTGEKAGVEAIAAGQQLVLEDAGGTQAFAGRELSFEGFTGVLGYSSEAAYVLVIDGTAALSEQVAEPGQMLLIPASGGRTDVVRFDAARFSESLTDDARGRFGTMLGKLQRIAGGQQTGIFLGRLGRTRLNVSAPGGATAELERRNLTSDPAIQKIRFVPDGVPQNTAQQVATAYLAALASGDTRTLAALSDPVPYGNAAMTEGATAARLAMARQMASSRSWRTLLAGAKLAPTSDATRWTVSGPSLSGTVLLRPMGDFIFVQGIELGEVK